MTAGLALVLTHNVWRADWPVIITILGWLAAIGGAVRIVMPQGTERVGRRDAQAASTASPSAASSGSRSARSSASSATSPLTHFT